jgi:DNA-binding transcriptional MocR family regulator
MGQPSPALLPHGKVQQAAAHRLALPSANLLLQYGSSRGLKDFIAAEQLLTPSYRYHVCPDNVFITAGVSQGLDLVVKQLRTQPGDAVLLHTGPFPASCCSLP